MNGGPGRSFCLPDDYTNVIHPAFTDEFEEFVTMMDEWEKKGYWPSDIMSSSTGGKEMYKNGLCTAYIAHMPDWTGNYQSTHGSLENQDIDDGILLKTMTKSL